MRKVILMTALFAFVISVSAYAAVWTPKAPDPNLWPYADGPAGETVILPHTQFRMGGAVGTYEGDVAIYSIGGRSGPAYTGYPNNRQSHFSIYFPATDTWISADGTDDTDNGDGTWTSVGLTGYNNANGTNSPLAGQGTGYVCDQAFFYGGNAYVFGGYPQWGGNMAKYTVATNSWSQVALGDNDGLYLDGGGLIGSHWYKVHRADALMDYDASTDTFGPDIAIAGLLDPKSGASSGVIGSKLYIVDTWEADTPGVVYEIDPIAGTVVEKAAAPIPVKEAGTVVFNGRLYLLGGNKTSDYNKGIVAIQIFDPALNTWFLSPDTLPSPRWGMLAEIAAASDPLLYVGNGHQLEPSGTEAYDDLWSTPIAGIAIPEPGTMMMLGSGLLGLLAFLKRKK